MIDLPRASGELPGRSGLRELRCSAWSAQSALYPNAVHPASRAGSGLYEMVRKGAGSTSKVIESLVHGGQFTFQDGPQVGAPVESRLPAPGAGQ